MAQTDDSGDLASRIAALESAERARQAAAAVGGTIVAARDAAAVTLTGVASTVGSVGWNYAGPTVDVFLPAPGRLLVMVAANFEVYGNKASLYAGFRLTGPADDAADLGAAPVAVAPSLESSAQLQDDGTGMNQLGAFGTFDLATGLADGWYRATQAYFLAYSGTTGAPYGIATMRRIAVTRY